MRCCSRQAVTLEEELMKLTRTLGAALGLVAVLLFFASLTFEQNRVGSLIARAPITHR
jgi:hypothetical protein